MRGQIETLIDSEVDAVAGGTDVNTAMKDFARMNAEITLAARNAQLQTVLEGTHYFYGNGPLQPGC